MNAMPMGARAMSGRNHRMGHRPRNGRWATSKRRKPIESNP